MKTHERLIIIIILVFGSIAPPAIGEPTAKEEAKAVPSPPFDVVFDQSYDQIFSPFDTSFIGYSKLAVMIRKRGGSVSVNSIPLHEFLPTYKGKHRILVLGIAFYQRYQEKDLQAIEAFLADGGGVLAMVEHDDYKGNATFQNDLLKHHGVEALPLGALTADPDVLTPMWPIITFPQWNCKNVQFFFAAPLRKLPSSKAIPFAYINKPKDGKYRLAGTLDTTKKGPFVVLTDAEFIWNGAPALGIDAGGNRSFTAKLLSYLAGMEGPLTPQEPSNKKAFPLAGKKRVLFEQTGFAMIPDGRRGGLNQFAGALASKGYQVEIGGGKQTDYSTYDLVIVVNPLEKLKSVDRIKSAKRLLLLAEGQSDLFGAFPQTAKEIREITKSKVPDNYYPLNDLAALFGFKFQSTVVSDNPRHFTASAVWTASKKPFILRRSAVIAPVSEEVTPRYQIMAKTRPGNWVMPSVLTIVDKSNPDRKPFDPPLDLDMRPSWPVIVTRDNVFAVADFDALTDPFFYHEASEYLFQQLLHWLGRKDP